MIIREKIGNLNTLPVPDKQVDWLYLEWFELSKRIMHKYTLSGREVVIKFLGASQQLTTGDVLFEDAGSLIVVDVLPCETIIIQPLNMYEMASVCYEIGNKHLPLFFENDLLLIPYDKPLYQLLLSQGYGVRKDSRKLLNHLKTTVSPHNTATENSSLFSKIMKLTTSSGKE